jgi:beta-mannosidase
MHRSDPGLDLGGEWSFAFTEERISPEIESVTDLRRAGLKVYRASVPGNFELDLLANGLIGEPFVGMNIVELRRFERTYVYYVRTFDAPIRPGTEPWLIFEGIDCVADILLNGQLVHRADNMLIEHYVRVADAVRPGAENTLCVVIEPALEHARSLEYEYPPGLEAEGSGYESLYVRKAPHMYGWDIMPRALSAGLWRSVTLHYLPIERLAWVWLETLKIAADGSRASLALHYRATTGPYPANAYSLRTTGTCGGSVFEHRARSLFDAGELRFEVDSPRLWWPRGRGDANLYDVRVELLRDEVVLDSLSFRHGIRTVGLDRTSITTEDGGGEFCFRVNGERLFVLGTNWVPLDAYHSRDRDRIQPALELVEDLGCNMIRCWGGNVYEDDLFYDLCDRMGILVWQDFAMACAVYPQDRPFQDRLRSEVRRVVRRLRQHACIALWAGATPMPTF